MRSFILARMSTYTSLFASLHLEHTGLVIFLSLVFHSGEEALSYFKEDPSLFNMVILFASSAIRDYLWGKITSFLHFSFWDYNLSRYFYLC